MAGHKTNGDWDDVTSYSRNEIVFEGRHKDYGAYYIRKRYNYALLLGLLGTLSVGVIGAGGPFLYSKFHKNDLPIAPHDHNRDSTITIIIPIDKKPPVHPTPPTHPPIAHPPASNVPHDPVVTKDPPPDKKDSLDKLNKNPQQPVDGPIAQGTDPAPVPPGNSGPPGPPTPPTPPAPPEPVKFAEVWPKFPGDINTYVTNHINYPTLYVDAGIEGTVYATFVVELDGSVSDIKILRGVAGGPKLSDETIKVIQNMPKWTPGQMHGQPVRVQYTLPVHFQISQLR
jgi:protein TonB